MSRYTGGLWNLGQNRDPVRAANQVHALLRTHDLDFLLTCETSDYTEALIAELDGTPWQFSGYTKDPMRRYGSHVPARDSAVIMRREYPSYRLLHEMGGVRWERGQGREGLHDPRLMVSDLIDGKFRVGSVHLPPTPRLVKFPLRDKAHRTMMRHLDAVVDGWQSRWLLGGDWNMKAGVTGPDTPKALAERRGAQIKGTGGIDYPMGYEVTLRHPERIQYGTSDHDPIKFEVVVR